MAQGDEFSQIITPITRQRPSEILHLLQNDFCNTIGVEADIPVTRADVGSVPMRAAPRCSWMSIVAETGRDNSAFTIIRTLLVIGIAG